MISHLLAPIAGVLLFASAGFAQQVGRDEYQAHLPSMPPRVGQTAASVRFSLYGDAADPLYRDSAPLDGIDDARGLQLLRLAARFSPVFRRNTFSRPMDFHAVLGGWPVLHVDTWSMGRRLASDSVLLYSLGTAARAPLGGGDGPDGDESFWAEQSRESARSDSVLARLVTELHPDASDPRVVRAEAPEEKTLFFDFPGEDERSWRAAYRDQSDSRIYAHFFINEDTGTPSSERYDFAIQYWLFYPFNDGPNNHEGDWEHLVVLVTTPARAAVGGPAAGRLDEHDVQRILTGGALIDSLVIHSVEYYFHESVITLDYLEAGRAPKHTHWQELGHLHVWEQPDFMVNAVADRVRQQDGQLATHPVGYIGGDAKGPDELMAIRPRFRGSYNRDSHGTYPFPGIWQGVGPLGSTEQVAGEVVPRLWQGLTTPAVGALAFADERMLSYGAGDILLLPDWERLKDLALVDPGVRREWSWILLPIRWGYPASASPGSGAVKHVDMGDLAPVGPMFQGTWNRLAPATGRHQYTPRVLRVMTAPVTPWDMIRNGWGVLNVPRTLLGFLPGYSVVVSQLSPWLSLPLVPLGAESPRTFAPEERPRRFTSSAFGRQRQFGGEAFARLLPAPGELRTAADLTPANESAAASGPVPEETAPDRSAAGGLRAAWSLYYGPRFSTQNAYSRSRSPIHYDMTDGQGNTAGRVEGVLEVQEILGGFQYQLRALGNSGQLFAGGGWGWTWYRVDHVTFAGEARDYHRKGGYAVTPWPSRRWWPNTWYGTVGLELTAPRSAWAFNRVGYGLQFQYTGLLHRLSMAKPHQAALGQVSRRELSVALVTSW